MSLLTIPSTSHFSKLPWSIPFHLIGWPPSLTWMCEIWFDFALRDDCSMTVMEVICVVVWSSNRLWWRFCLHIYSPWTATPKILENPWKGKYPSFLKTQVYDSVESKWWQSHEEVKWIGRRNLSNWKFNGYWPLSTTGYIRLAISGVSHPRVSQSEYRNRLSGEG